ncbi:MAG TPA: hypothetical protein VM115_07890 [Vicinamibacterales bacterium]|nr:hypothetical protein [Vicinamibacterales bacterium]
MRIESWAGVTAVLLLILTGAIAAESQQCRLSSLPVNLEMRRDLARVVERIYRRSPVFRAQCERIARADHLRVMVRIDTAIPARCRAFTIVKRQGYAIVADVHLPPSNGLVELVAHEFEHVLEQIEGLDLKRLARVKGSGVHELEGRVFETDRAQRAGRLVIAEMERAVRPANDLAD